MNDERFWAKVNKTESCWLWTAGKGHNGYGLFRASGKRVRAHRYALTLTGVDIPGGMQVDHTCHIRHCVNPDHLRVVTNKQNHENLSGANRNSKTGVRGVHWQARDARWRARVQHDGRFYAAYFTDIAEARAWVIAKRNELFTHNDADRVAS